MDEVGKTKLLDYEKSDWIFIAVLFLVGLWLLGPGFIPNRMMLPIPDDVYVNPDIAYDIPVGAVPISDTNLEYQPWNDYACSRLKKGEMPWWNPYNLCGTPFYADSLNQLTYIPRLILSIILPSEMVLTVLALMHLLLAGIGFYYLMKAFNASPVAAGLAAFVIVFKFSHPTVMMMPPVALTLAYMPAILLLIVKMIRGGRWLYILLLAICLSCIISSGYPVFVVHMLYLGIAVVVFEYIRTPERKSQTIGRIILAGILGLMFSLAQLIPLYLFYTLSARTAAGQALSNFHVDFRHIALMLYQNLIIPLWDKSDPYSPMLKFGNLYYGLIPILLLLPFYGQWKDSRYRFYFITSLVIGAICFITPVARLFLLIVPGARLTVLMPYPALFLCLTIAFGLSLQRILTGFRENISFHKIPVIIVALLFLALPAAMRLMSNQPDDFSPNFIAYSIVLIILVGCLLFRTINKRSRLAIGVFIALLAVSYLPMMTKWTTFYSPDNGSFGLRVKRNGPIDEFAALNAPRYFNATSSAFLESNINIYPRMRFVQGYDSLILSHFADGYRAHVPGGIIAKKRLTTREYGKWDEYLAETGTGSEIINPLQRKWSVSISITGNEVPIEEINAPEYVMDGRGFEIERRKPELYTLTALAGDVGDLRIAETWYPGWVNDVNEMGPRPMGMTQNGFMRLSDTPTTSFEGIIYYNPWLEKLSITLSIVSFIISLIAISALDCREKLKPEK